MAYYIISFDPGPMKAFQKKLSFLNEAIWIKEKNDLAPIKPSPGEDPFFFIHLTKSAAEKIDEMVLIIRDSLITAKIVYVTEEKMQDMKTHQSSPVGGDAYVNMQIEPSNLSALLEGLLPPDLNQFGNRLETKIGNTVTISAQQGLEKMRNHPKSKEIEEIFNQVFKKDKKPLYQSANTLVSMTLPDELEISDLGEADMSDKELSLDDLGDLEMSTDAPADIAAEDGGMDLSLDDEIGLDLSAGDDLPTELPSDDGMDLNLDDSFSLDEAADEAPELGDEEESDDDVGLSLDADEEEVPDLDFGSGSDEDVGLDLGGDSDSDSLSLSDDSDDGVSLDLSGDSDSADVDLSDDALEKLKEIDAIMDQDASQVSIKMDLGSDDEDTGDDIGLSLGEDDSADVGLDLGSDDSDVETSLVSDDLDLGSISFTNEDEEADAAVAAAPVKEEKSKKKTKEPVKESYDGEIGRELKEISGAYSGEMERMQATISNLRADREELLAKIQKQDEDKVMQNRQILTMRAELDEKKIELSIMRKKLNDEISELKDRVKLHDERKMILEEKNKILMVELDKAAQKNKIDVKKVQMRERELEQKLELLKSDSESQVRHRDLKILELKRKLDAMEFDVESISMQEKRSVESRFELEDKLDKAIKTLRSAITVLEDETDKSGAIDALKKNIDM